MKYIEIRPGINIQKEAILKVESIDMMTCKLTTMVGVEECVYPSWRILGLLEVLDIKNQIAGSSPDNPSVVSTRNLWGNQHWAG